MTTAYNRIDRILREKLSDDDYPKYKEELEAICQAKIQRIWVDLTRTQIQNVYFEILKEHRGGHQMQGQLAFGEALQAKIKEVNR